MPEKQIDKSGRQSWKSLRPFAYVRVADCGSYCLARHKDIDGNDRVSVEVQLATVHLPQRNFRRPSSVSMSGEFPWRLMAQA